MDRGSFMFNLESRPQFPDLSGVAVQSDASYLAPELKIHSRFGKPHRAAPANRKRIEKANRKGQE